jgi:hypothetical protein
MFPLSIMGQNRRSVFSFSPWPPCQELRAGSSPGFEDFLGVERRRRVEMETMGDRLRLLTAGPQARLVEISMAALLISVK